MIWSWGFCIPRTYTLNELQFKISSQNQTHHAFSCVEFNKSQHAVPVAVLIAWRAKALLKDGLWFKLHRALAYIGVIMAAIGFVCWGELAERWSVWFKFFYPPSHYSCLETALVPGRTPPIAILDIWFILLAFLTQYRSQMN